MNQYHGRLWPDVTSPLARRVLTEAFNNSPIDAEDYYYDIYTFQGASGQYPSAISQELEDYRRELRTRLAGSDLAARLLDPGWIEACDTSLACPLRQYAQLVARRDVEGAVHHFTRNIDWYLGIGGTRPMTPYKQIAVTIGALLLLIAGVASIFMFSQNIAVFIAGPLAIAIAAAVMVLNLVAFQGSAGPFEQKQMIARAEFYLYLRDTLRDNNDLEPDTSA